MISEEFVQEIIERWEVQTDLGSDLLVSPGIGRPLKNIPMATAEAQESKQSKQLPWWDTPFSFTPEPPSPTAT